MNRADLEAMAQRELQRQQSFRCRVLCCASTPCLSSGGSAVYDAINDAIKEGGLDADVQAVATGCMGPCSRGPMITVQMRDGAEVIYEHVTPETGRQIVAHHAAEEPCAPRSTSCRAIFHFLPNKRKLSLPTVA
jgi:bidirectional [NiFe] hydrogenase diaphorase subunit